MSVESVLACREEPPPILILGPLVLLKPGSVPSGVAAHLAPVTRTGGVRMTACHTCADLNAKLAQAEEKSDHSAATDCRVLLRRHAPGWPTREGPR